MKVINISLWMSDNNTRTIQVLIHLLPRNVLILKYFWIIPITGDICKKNY